MEVRVTFGKEINDPSFPLSEENGEYTPEEYADMRNDSAEDKEEIGEQDNAASEHFSLKLDHSLLTPAQELACGKTIRTCVEKIARAKRRLKKTGIPAKEKKMLFAKMGKAEQEMIPAKNMLIKHNLRLVKNIADRYQGAHLTARELFDEGYFGLERAAMKFDDRKGYRFSTYAVRWIHSKIKYRLKKTRGDIGIPVWLQETKTLCKRISDEFSRNKGVDPTIEELARATRKPVESIKRAMNYSYPTFPSLHTKVGDSKNTELWQMIPAPQNPEQDCLLRKQLNRLLRSLTEKERKIIHLLCIEEERGEDVGALFGFSGQWARQIRNAGLKKIREAIAKDPLLQKQLKGN